MIHESARQTMFYCGPLQIVLNADDDDLSAKIAETLLLYDFTWPPPHRLIEIHATTAAPSHTVVGGNFLRCSRMLVDSLSGGLVAATTSGARARGTYRGQGEHWDVEVPHSLVQAGKLEEIEDILSLILTTGWRRAGWTPIHAAAVVSRRSCAIICAPTGGGKTTLTAALVRRGWRVLGDDKILLRMKDGKPEIAALLHTFNLHPRTSTWFPEVGDLEALPRYSAWTEKRKVSIASIWSDAPAHFAHPSTLISLQRCSQGSGVTIVPLDERGVLTTLLRQTVIPSDRATARPIIEDVARTARQVHGIQIEIATDAYHDEHVLTALEAHLGGGA